jgi:hypothetical protein
MGNEDNKHYVTSDEMIDNLQHLQPGAKIRISDGVHNYFILSIYDGDADDIWIDIGKDEKE